VLVFVGSALLTSHPYGSYQFVLPTSFGLLFFILLLVTQYHQEPLSPIGNMWTTIPIIGTLAAMIGGGLSFSFLELAEQFHMRVEHNTPWQTGLLLWLLIAGVAFSAGLFGVLSRTRLLPFMVVIGMLCIMIGGGSIGSRTHESGGTPTVFAAGLMGWGAGATVSPALLMSGFSLASRMLGRIFAMIELIRSCLTTCWAWSSPASLLRSLRVKGSVFPESTRRRGGFPFTSALGSHCSA